MSIHAVARNTAASAPTMAIQCQQVIPGATVDDGKGNICTGAKSWQIHESSERRDERRWIAYVLMYDETIGKYVSQMLCQCRLSRARCASARAEIREIAVS